MGAAFSGFDMLLLAAQASGLAANIWQSKKQNKYDMAGLQLQQKQLDLKMQQDALASSQESLINIEKLRETMSAQRAMVAARGQMMQGSNFFVAQKSLKNYDMDEQARKLSLGFNKYNNKASQALLKLEYLGRKSERKNQLIGTGLNMLSFNSLAGKTINDLLGSSRKKSASGLND